MESQILEQKENLIDFGPLQGRPDPRNEKEKEAGELVTLINAGTLTFALEALSNVIADMVHRRRIGDDLNALVDLQKELARNIEQIFYR